MNGGAVVTDLALRHLAAAQEAGRFVHRVEARGEALDRLVDDGHLRRKRTRIFGFIPSESFEPAGARRAELLARVRATLVGGVTSDPRTAAIAALLSASANLHRFDPDIPWTSRVIHRAKELENGSWGAAAAGEAVTLATIAVISGALLATTAGNGAG